MKVYVPAESNTASNRKSKRSTEATPLRWTLICFNASSYFSDAVAQQAPSGQQAAPGVQQLAFVVSFAAAAQQAPSGQQPAHVEQQSPQHGEPG
jgi:hypothetical protein